MNDIIKQSILTFLAGVFCKLYDDLNDNNLFHSFHLEHNKSYINEFLKTSHTILLISASNIYTLLSFITPNLLLCIIDSKSVESPYEYSSIIAFSLFSLYATIDNFSTLKFNYLLPLIIIYLFGTYFCDTRSFKNVEFGYNKLVARGVCTVIMILVLVINYYIKLCPDELLLVLYYSIGYFLTSCMFQVYLLKTVKPKKNLKTKKNKLKKMTD